MFDAALRSACLRPRGDSKRCATAAFDALLLNGSQLDLHAQGGQHVFQERGHKPQQSVDLEQIERSMLPARSRTGWGPAGAHFAEKR